MLRGGRAAAAGMMIVASIGALMAIDLNTGQHFSIAIFYLVPTAAAGWYLGRTLGVATGVLAGVAWGFVDYLTRTDSVAATAWNGATRIAGLVALAFMLDMLRYLIGSLRESQERQRAQLDQRAEFLSLMAHELRAPVAAIEVVAAGLSEAPALGARERRALTQLRGQARSLSALAEGVLTANQLDAGTMQLEPETFDVCGLISEIAEPLGRVSVTCPAGSVLVRADPDALQRALSNLVSNALKFSPFEDMVQVIIHRDERETRIDISDQGIGLSAEDAGRLFTKYSRIRDERTASIEGVGLGLYFTRLIVEAHGGTVTAHSRGAGEGSTFSVHLPHVNAPERSPGAEAAANV
jgi:signal transduction histidine kinase